MDPQNDFFTLQSLATFAGAVGATTVIANGCQRAFNFNPSWFALILSELICIIVVVLSHADAAGVAIPPKSDYFVAIVNGFLVYCSAGGTTSLLNSASGGGSASVQARGVDSRDLIGSKPKRRFFSPWF